MWCVTSDFTPKTGFKNHRVLSLKHLRTFSGAEKRAWGAGGVNCSSHRPQGHGRTGSNSKRCCQPGQIDTSDLTSLSARKGKPKLKHSMLVSLCVRSNKTRLYRSKCINGFVWLKRKKKTLKKKRRMTKICICCLTVYFLLGKSGIKATFMHTKQMFMISS